MRVVFIVLIVFISSACSKFITTKKSTEKFICETAVVPQTADKLEEFDVDLDLPPAKRWVKLMDAKASQTKDLVVTFKSLIKSIPVLGNFLINIVETKFDKIFKKFPESYQQELQYIANKLNLPIGDIVMYNIIYELTTVCTSIVAQAPNGHMIHARNMDFGEFVGYNKTDNQWLLTDKLRSDLVIVNFKKGGKTVIKAVQFPGYVGIISGLTDKFSITVNQRFSLKPGLYEIFKWVMGWSDGQWLAFFLRDTMLRSQNYDDFVKYLVDTPLLAGIYFIVGGPKATQGAVITRSPSKMEQVRSIAHDGSPDGWYVLQTNYDWWKSAPFFDNRRGMGVQCMRSVGPKNVTFESMFNVLSSKPVLNMATVYSVLMDVTAGKFEAYKQTCKGDCDPF